MAISFDWNQFKPYEEGGITGGAEAAETRGQSAPAIDQPPMATNPTAPAAQPGFQFDPSQYNFITDPGSRMGPGGSISPGNPETAWMFNPDGTPKQKSGFGFWNPPPGLRPEPIVDPSRYDPNLSYEDYYRDYWAPDREAVLRGVPNQPVRHLHEQVPGSYMPYSGYTPSGYGTLNQIAQRVQQMSSGANNQGFAAANNGGNPFSWSNLGRAAVAAGGVTGNPFSWSGLGRAAISGFGGGSPAGGTVRVRTPSGRELSVPSNQLQEALRRGATKIG